MKRILIIDDDHGVTEMTKLNLETTGKYEVCTENRSARALQTARKFQPDLILLDYVMPEMDGGDVLSQLKQDPLLNSIPVLFVTALLDNTETGPDGTKTVGRQVMLAKPITVQTLIRCIEAQLARHALAP